MPGPYSGNCLRRDKEKTPGSTHAVKSWGIGLGACDNNRSRKRKSCRGCGHRQWRYGNGSVKNLRLGMSGFAPGSGLAISSTLAFSIPLYQSFKPSSSFIALTIYLQIKPYKTGMIIRGRYCNAPVRPYSNSGKPIINTPLNAAMNPSSAPYVHNRIPLFFIGQLSPIAK